MAPSILKITLFSILSLITSTTLAFDDISVPWIVTADTDFKVTITNDINTTRSFDAGFTHYKIYLATTPPGWGTGPVCVLVNSSKIDVESHTIQIPASVGPRGKYELTTMEWNEDPREDGPSGFQYSNSFDLKGGSGEWGEAELNGHGIGNADRIPCTAYDCARKCNDDNYPASTDNGKKGFEAYKTAYNCVAKCPGVTVLPWSTWYSEDADSFDDERDEDSDDGDSNDEDSTDGSLSDTSTLSSTASRTATILVSESLQTMSTSSLAISITSSTATITAASGSTPTSSAGVVTPSPAAGAGSQASVPALILLAGCIGSTIAVLAL